MSNTERLYWVEENYVECAGAEVWASSKEEAIRKFLEVEGTKDAYYKYFTPGGQLGGTTARLARNPDGSIQKRATEVLR